MRTHLRDGLLPRRLPLVDALVGANVPDSTRMHLCIGKLGESVAIGCHYRCQSTPSATALCRPMAMRSRHSHVRSDIGGLGSARVSLTGMRAYLHQGIVAKSRDGQCRCSRKKARVGHLMWTIATGESRTHAASLPPRSARQTHKSPYALASSTVSPMESTSVAFTNDTIMYLPQRKRW